MDMREVPLAGGTVGAGDGRAGGAEGAEVFNLSESGQTH